MHEYCWFCMSETELYNRENLVLEWNFHSAHKCKTTEWIAQKGLQSPYLLRGLLSSIKHCLSNSNDNHSQKLHCKSDISQHKINSNNYSPNCHSNTSTQKSLHS